jgi:diguanylate cyclase (GGDEF)-like protein
MTTHIALVAALALLVLLGCGMLFGRVSNRRNRTEASEALAIMGARMDEIVHRLGETLERVGQDHPVGGVAQAFDTTGVHDLDDLLERAVDAAGRAADVDAALIRVQASDGSVHVRSTGIAGDLAESQVLSGPPDGRGVRAIAVDYRYGAGDDPPGALRVCVAVPVQHRGRPLGFVAAYSLDPDIDSSRLIAALESIAQVVATAAATHVERKEGEHDPDAPGATSVVDPQMDSLTGLRNRTGFHDSLVTAVARAARLRRPLALVVVDVDSFKALNARLGPLAGDDVLRRVAARIRECLREGDVACRIGSDEFAVILPETGRPDAEGFLARLNGTLQRKPLDGDPTVTVSGGIAELGPADDALGLFNLAEVALERSRGASHDSVA